MMLRLAFTSILLLLLPAVLVRLFYRGLTGNRGYWRHWSERFGGGEPTGDGDSKGGCVWVHAVSVGEVQAAVPLVFALKARYPNCRLLLTTATPTGRQRALQVFGRAVSIRHIPFDLPWFWHRFHRRHAPRMAVMMETELWPNLLSGCVDRGVPVVLANARLSARSAAGYRRIASLTGWMLRQLTLIGAQSEADAGRFRDLGADAAAVVVCGNVKLDVKVSASASEAAQVLRRAWGPDRGVWIAASTHPGEDEAVLAAHQALREQDPGLVLVLVPRHPERAETVARMCTRAGLNVVRRTEHPVPTPQADVYLGDTLGELLTFYAAADVAFVGGSLVTTGGHNLLEPAALGVPVVVGPHTFNFAELTRQAVEAGLARQVAGEEALTEELSRLLRDPEERHRMGLSGRQFVALNAGALERLLTYLVPIIDERLELP